MLQKQTRRKKTIDKYSYISDQIIGQGYSSTVYKGKHQETNQEIALKIIQRNIIKYQIHKSMILCEIQFLSVLKNQKNIIQLIEVINSKQKIYLVLQLCEDDLGNEISKRKQIPQAQAIQILKDIISGYKSIWKANIFHRDIKPTNILRKQNSFVIADFGFAIFEKDKKQYDKINVGSPLYMPHQVLGYNQYSYKSDIWAIGIIFYEMLVGNAPWKSKSEKSLFKQLAQLNIQKIIPFGISNSSKQFLIKCLQFDPYKRMSPEELVDFKFQILFKPFKQNNEQAHKLILQTQKQTEGQKIKKSNSQTQKKTFQVREKNQNSTFQKATSQKLIKQKEQNFQNEQQNQIQVDLYKLHPQNMLKKARSKNCQQQNQFKMEEINISSPTKLRTKRNVSRKTSLQVDYQPKPFQLKDIPQLKTPQKQFKIKNNQQIENQMKDYVKKQTDLDSINRQQTFQVMKQFSKELRSQIHFCRFIYKLLIRIIEKIQQKLVRKEMRDQMKLMIFQKLNQISNKKIQNQNIMKEWLQTRQYDKINKIVTQYLIKYQQTVGEVQLDKKFDLKTFKNLLIRSIVKIYNLAYQAYQKQIQDQKEEKAQKTKVKRTQSSKSTENDQEDGQSEIMKLKDKIIVLDYLITFKQLIGIQQKYGWKVFVQKSKIQTIVQSEPLNYIQTHHIEELSKKLQKLKIF